MGCKYEVEGHHDTIEKMLYILLRERPQKLVREGGGGLGKRVRGVRNEINAHTKGGR